MDKERFQKQLSFILEVDKAKNILRQTHLSGFVRRENDAEHSWHIALMTYLLKEYSNKEFDVAKAMIMALIHDVVEIDAGDTYAYDEQGLKTQKEREKVALNRICGLLPNDQKHEFINLFNEFEEGKTPEARFVKTMDNLQPLLLNDYNDGKDWRERKVNKEKVYNRQKTSQLGSSKIWEFTKEVINKNVEKGNIIEE